MTGTLDDGWTFLIRLVGPIVVVVIANFSAFAYVELVIILDWLWRVVMLYVRLPVKGVNNKEIPIV